MLASVGKGWFPSPSVFFFLPRPPAHGGGLRGGANGAKVNSPAPEGYIHQADHLPAGVDVEAVELYVRSYTVREEGGWESGSFADEGHNPSHAGRHPRLQPEKGAKCRLQRKMRWQQAPLQGPPTVLASGEGAQVGPSVRVQGPNLSFAAHKPRDFGKLIFSIRWEQESPKDRLGIK